MRRAERVAYISHATMLLCSVLLEGHVADDHVTALHLEGDVAETVLLVVVDEVTLSLEEAVPVRDLLADVVGVVPQHGGESVQEVALLVGLNEPPLLQLIADGGVGDELVLAVGHVLLHSLEHCYLTILTYLV